MESLEDEYAIGLDLGTTFSCIGVYRNDWVEIIPNRIGEKITPSVVIITKDAKVLVGEQTDEFLVKNYDSCIYEVKRLIGRSIDEEERKKLEEKFPFHIVKANKGNFPEIQVKTKKKKLTYSPVEISSYIIKKMVYNAEQYLKKAITKLVITVPAYFNDSQRALTRQAAEALGLKVLRIINEPTAAALAYGFDEKQKKNSNLLIFDLGGGTFDVSILSLKKDKEKNETIFEVLGTSGDTNLGGEDFDNALVDLVLKKIIDPEIVAQIRKDKQAMKRLKVFCENTKKLLSVSEKADIRINEIIKKCDIIQTIHRKDFEIECQPLFDKLYEPIEKALKIANEKEKNIVINEVILVGGSTRIPKIKQIIRDYFPNSKINDSINPDEAVAYGATLEAEKILHPQGNKMKNFSLLDVTPFSLGTDVTNTSKDPEIKKEGPLMDVIIKRGVHLPFSASKIYTTFRDNQTTMSIDIYEGEKKYIKYNHLLKKSTINNLTKRPKGKTLVKMIFDIDANGILNVQAQEKTDDGKGQVVNLVIKNDEVSLSNEEMEKLKNKMKSSLDKFGEKNEENDNNDYINIKGILKKFYDDYEKYKNKIKNKKKKDNEENEEDEEDEDDEDKAFTCLNNYYTTLEKFIDKFDRNFDNETVLYKFYLYIRDLFKKYLEALKLSLDKGDKEHIFNQINKYITIFIDKSSGYLNELLEILSTLKKGKNRGKFYTMILFVISKLNELGQTCIFSNKPFCKYHSIRYFELSNFYFDKYFPLIIDEKEKEKNELKDKNEKEKEIENRENISLLPVQEFKSIIKIAKSNNEFLLDINSGAILLSCKESLTKSELINGKIFTTSEQGTGNTAKSNLLNLDKMNRDNQKIFLDNYEKLLSEIQISKEFTKKEAICIANIIKIYSFISPDFGKNSRNLIPLAKRCEKIAEHLNLDKKEKWYLEFEKLYKKLKEYEPKDLDYPELLAEMKAKYPDIFRTIDYNYNNMEKKDFIKFIIKEHPYIDAEKDQDKNFDDYSPEILRYLINKYLPDNYKYMRSKEATVLKYCVVQEISKKLNHLFSNY